MNKVYLMIAGLFIALTSLILIMSTNTLPEDRLYTASAQYNITPNNKEQILIQTKIHNDKKYLQANNSITKKPHNPEPMHQQKTSSMKTSNEIIQLTPKQKNNLANEQVIQKNGWLIHPLNDVEGAPILKYVPYMDNSGRFHTVQVYDMTMQPAYQLIHAYTIPYTDNFPHISVQQAKNILQNDFITNIFTPYYQHKLVWTQDKYKPYYLFECVNKQDKKSTIHCLVNAYDGFVISKSVQKNKS